MTALINEIIDVLEHQGRILAGMLKAAGEQRLALIKNDSRAIMAAVMRLEELSQTLRRHDMAREGVQQRLASEMKLEQRAVLSDILIRAGESPEAQRLKQVTGDVWEKVNRLAELNKMNRVLAYRGMQFTSRLISIMPHSVVTYMGSGEFKSERKSAAVLNKTI